MSNEAQSIPVEIPTESLPWYKVWFRAVTSPRVETYEALLRDPQASARRAYWWVCLVAYLPATVMSFLALWIFFLYASQGEELSDSMVWIYFVSSLAIAAVFPLIALTVLVGSSQLIAKALGGSGTFTQMSYATGAYLAPLMLVGGVVGLLTSLIIPLLGFCMTMPLYAYGLVLNAIAVKAVHRLGWGGAAFSSVVIVIFMSVMGVVAMVVLYLVMVALQFSGNLF